MSPCKRGCCWTPFSACGLKRAGPCHYGDWLTQAETDTQQPANTITHKDPTPRQALNNITRRQGRNHR